MPSASSLECCKAFMQWASRFGVPKVAISDNGNSFVANLYQEIMKTFNVEVKFTPAYHAATNGAIERRHRTIKEALKASLIDMGNKHQDKWMRALPWVLLGKRTAYQPDLDTSSAMLAFGRSPLLPGQLLGHPGPPLTSIQTKALLEEMFKLETNPALPMSTKTTVNDISSTDNVTHVYVKVDEPKGLSCRYEGPYPIVARPSRSQIEVRVGSFANGSPRTCTFHWSTCKLAHLRDDFIQGSRPILGRKKLRPDPPVVETRLADAQPDAAVELPLADESSRSNQNNGKRGNIQTPVHDTLSGRAPHPDYVAKGPVITREMFNKWTPDLLNIPSTPSPSTSSPSTERPVRSTRNPALNYVGALINSL